jgi:hypothetical protein
MDANHRAKTLKIAFAQADAETAKNFGVDIKKILNPNTKKPKPTVIKSQKKLF